MQGSQRRGVTEDDVRLEQAARVARRYSGELVEEMEREGTVP